MVLSLLTDKQICVLLSCEVVLPNICYLGTFLASRDCCASCSVTYWYNEPPPQLKKRHLQLCPLGDNNRCHIRTSLTTAKNRKKECCSWLSRLVRSRGLQRYPDVIMDKDQSLYRWTSAINCECVYSLAPGNESVASRFQYGPMRAGSIQVCWDIHYSTVFVARLICFDPRHLYLFCLVLFLFLLPLWMQAVGCADLAKFRTRQLGTCP